MEKRLRIPIHLKYVELLVEEDIAMGDEFQYVLELGNHSFSTYAKFSEM